MDAALEPIKLSNCTTEPPDPVHGTLSHYYQKSFEEFGVKAHRGSGSEPGGLKGKSLRTFFEWDVPVTPTTYNPAPPRLLARVRHKLAALLSDPAIASAEQAVEQAYLTLSQRVNGNELDATFHSLRAQFQPTVFCR